MLRFWVDIDRVVKIPAFSLSLPDLSTSLFPTSRPPLFVKGLPLREQILEPNGTMVLFPLSHCPTVPLSHCPTIPQSHSPTVPQSYSPTVPQFHSPT